MKEATGWYQHTGQGAPKGGRPLVEVFGGESPFKGQPEHPEHAYDIVVNRGLPTEQVIPATTRALG